MRYEIAAILALLIADAVQLLCNPFFHHAFDLEAVEISGAAYYTLIPYIGQNFHRVLCFIVITSGCQDHDRRSDS